MVNKRSRRTSLWGLFLALFVTIALASCGSSKSEEPAAEESATAAPETGKSTLELVKERGKVIVGVTAGVPGYSAPDSEGIWQGFDVDLGRAVAAAVLGDPDAIECRPLSAKERFTALQSGEIDVLVRVTTWTATRDSQLGVNFAGVNYYDGQGFMVAKDSGITSLADLDGATVAVQSGTTTELNLSDYFRKNNMDFELITFEKNDQASAALEAGRADAVTSDQSQLYALRTKFKEPENFIMLPELISKEPLGPVVRQGDDEWFNIVKWTLFAMLNAEEYGITSDNVDEMKETSDNPNVKRLLGSEGGVWEGFGLESNAGYNIIKYIGNYGESFERNLGSGSPLNISRGLNALWTKGGIQYGMPIR
ncbi:amino acid ABC transporter substrate-binding protein [Sediminispirochaeta smaragdinae]|uniref:Extracellular solute-binding protein family 3 n=1 Tax=Sediminispirochaeta smaragdinae (strain DSM 11293 / JCM 15392 / SEBR 4228) TaxID=573413 RepID=E1RAN0_SEDSS|nr:amino acid ABC transporter substrate-binding protein [Sediminispirochaeta smaragdinae]ADK82398.1 extracellular solute-binding protein family 3 [Sediminispirochaeta smaragdinae DSM 11293]